LLLESATLVPPGPAGPLRLTVPVELLPPTTVVGLRLIDANVAGVRVSVADFEFAPNPAVIFTVVFAFTAVVATSNTAVLPPLATLTELGTTAFGLLVERAIVAPSAGAACKSVMVPVVEAPPWTVVGERLIFVNGGLDRMIVHTMPKSSAPECDAAPNMLPLPSNVTPA
jgi:hypothetical protein